MSLCRMVWGASCMHMFMLTDSPVCRPAATRMHAQVRRLTGDHITPDAPLMQRFCLSMVEKLRPKEQTKLQEVAPKLLKHWPAPPPTPQVSGKPCHL